VERALPDLSIESTDRPLRADQYVYVETHAWWMGTYGLHTHLSEHLHRQWVPARSDREWLLVRELTGARQWLAGSEEDAAADGFDPAEIAPVGRFVARHGLFDLGRHTETELDEPPCAPAPPRRGTWQTPNSTFFAELPRDPGELRARLVVDNPGSWFGPFAAAVNALRTCLVPAPLRQSLYEALLGLPDVSVVENVPDLDERKCTALAHDAGRTRTELLIDPDGGQFAGERDTLRTDSRTGLPIGTVISDTAVVTGVVDVLGAPPGAV
jgi:hypothetical protein